MTVSLKSLRAERAKAVADARALVDAADAEKRAMTDDENRQFGAFMDDADRLAGKIKQEEDLRSQEQAIAAATEQSDEEERRKKRDDEPDPMAGFRSWLAHGRAEGADGEAFRSLSATANTEGGFLVAPEQFVTNLIKAIDDMVFLRGLATKYTVERAASLGAPELTADPSDADWTTELQTGSEDSAMGFGKRSIYPHPLAKRIKVSSTLLRMSTIPVENLVQGRLGYKFGITEEKAFMTGNGNQQPLGVFTASANGIPTSRDVSDGNTATAFTADGIINAMYHCKGQYHNRGVWVFHRDAVKMLAKLKDGEGQYLWSAGLRGGDTDMLRGRPMYMSEYAPNTFTTGLYVGIFGDFSHYWVVDAMNMQVQRLNELYAETNQVGFIGRKETDGAPVLAEAFARVKLG